MTIIATANTANEANQIARSSPPGNVPSGTDSTIAATIRVLQKKSAIIRTFTRVNLTQFILHRVYHPYYSGQTESTTFILNLGTDRSYGVFGTVEFQEHHTNQACHKPDIVSPEYGGETMGQRAAVQSGCRAPSS